MREEGEGLGGLRQVTVDGESCRVRGAVREEPRVGEREVSVQVKGSGYQVCRATDPGVH